MKFTHLPEKDQAYLREHMDDNQIDLLDEAQTHTLVRGLSEYINELTEEVINLRKMINNYDKKAQGATGHLPKSYQEPYADLYSDIFRSFYDYDAYEKFKEELDILSI